MALDGDRFHHAPAFQVDARRHDRRRRRVSRRLHLRAAARPADRADAAVRQRGRRGQLHAARRARRHPDARRSRGADRVGNVAQVMPGCSPVPWLAAVWPTGRCSRRRSASRGTSDRLRRAFVAVAHGRRSDRRRCVASCARCALGRAGREAATLRSSVDGKYSQHLLLARGEAGADYRVSLGTVAAGPHTADDRARCGARAPRGAGRPRSTCRRRNRVRRCERRCRSRMSMAPFLYARPDTVGRFTDVPVFMWYEVEADAARARSSATR